MTENIKESNKKTTLAFYNLIKEIKSFGKNINNSL